MGMRPYEKMYSQGQNSKSHECMPTSARKVSPHAGIDAEIRRRMWNSKPVGLIVVRDTVKERCYVNRY